MTDDVAAGTRAVVLAATEQARTAEARDELAAVLERLEGPLRLAIAGKVKSGKSTLLNALLGEELAPTDAGECTKIVTWYVNGHAPMVQLYPLGGGSPEDRPFSRNGGALKVDLGRYSPDGVDRLVVHWPTGRLRELTVMDTPGIASISAEISERTHRVLAAADARVPTADAVLYLLRHAHASDVRFLESFHDDELAHGTPMNAVGVLSRSDEIGSCRLDAMEVAARVAARYESDHRLRRLCPIVVPVDSLLGYAAATLREAEYALLARIAAAPPVEIANLLLTVDRLQAERSPVDVTQLERSHLLGRLGLYGVRLSVELIRTGSAPNAIALAEELARVSGVDRLRTVVLRQFLDRSRVLKARSAIAAVEELVRRDAFSESGQLLRRIEEVEAGAHEFEELRLLQQLRADGVEVGKERAEDLDRLLGGSGHDSASRLGLPDDAGTEEVREAALETLGAWQRLAEHPLSSRSGQLAARTVIRTLEGIVAATWAVSEER
jgi:hypothetical protein